MSLLKAAAFGLLLGLLGNIANVYDDVRAVEEHIGLDLLFQLRGATTAPAEALVVAIDSESSERLNVAKNPDRWPRTLHARLIEHYNAGAGSV